MARDELVYLRHILDAIHTVEEYLQDVDEEKFKATRLLQDGTIRQIEIIGEEQFGIFQRIFAKRILKSPGRMLQVCAINSFMAILVLTLKRFGIPHRMTYLY